MGRMIGESVVSGVKYLYTDFMNFDPQLFQRRRAPIYLQLAKLMRQRIEQGDWKLGDRVPTLEALGATYGVARSTLREALAQLEGEGLIRRSRGELRSGKVLAGLDGRRLAGIGDSSSPIWLLTKLLSTSTIRSRVAAFFKLVRTGVNPASSEQRPCAGPGGDRQ